MKCEQCAQDMAGTPSKDPRTKVPRVKKVDGPDGTTAWVVAFSAFLINFIMAGLSRMSGILYVAFIEMFHTDRKGASMPFSVRSSTMNLLGPVVGILGQKYGVRIVSICGGVLGMLSSAACFFVNDIGWITVIWGGINGAGTALVTTLTTVTIAEYFDEYLTTASGLSFSGACIGSFIFPPLIEYLLHVYGLEGSFLIVAGIIMHTIPAAMILRKPIWVKIANRKAKDIESANRKEREIESAKLVEKCKNLKSTLCNVDANPTNDVDLNYLRTNSELVVSLLTTDLSPGDKGKNMENIQCPSKDEILKEMEDVYTFVGKPPVTLSLSEVPPKMRIKFEYETSPVSSRSRSFRTPRDSWRERASRNVQSPLSFQSPTDFRTQPPQCKPYILSKLNELRNKSEIQIVSSFSEQSLYKKVLKELRKLHKVYEAIKKRNLFAHTKPDLKEKVPSPILPEPLKDSTSNGIWGNIKNSIKLHANPLFLLVSLCRAVHFTAFVPVVTIIVDYAMDKGFMEDDGMYVIAALSVGDLLGRLCLGWVTDRGFISLPKYMLIVMIVQGFFTALLPMTNTMITFLPAVAVYAMLQGSVFVRHTVLLCNYLKKDERSIASGCVNFFAGLLGFAVPYYVGFFRDSIGSYDGIFYINGAVGAATGLLWAFEPFFLKLSSPASKEFPDSNDQEV